MPANMAAKKNKSQIVTDIHARLHGQVSKAVISAVLAEMAEHALETLAQGCQYPLGRIGRLQPMQVKARVARNPKTGEEVNVPAQIRIKFSPSAQAKRDMRDEGFLGEFDDRI